MRASTSTTPRGVANQRCPSFDRTAEGWLLAAVSLLRSPSAVPNSIQCRQTLLAVSAIAACNAVVSSEPQVAVLVVEDGMDRYLIETSAGHRGNLVPSQMFRPWSCVPISMAPLLRGNSAVKHCLKVHLPW